VSWSELLRLIEDEVGAEAASRIEDRARVELGGLRVTVLKRKLISLKDIDRAAPGRPREAARRLGVSVNTVYRVLRRPTIR
jgi:transcriptional regulator of acetoin/glycerol metabolism